MKRIIAASRACNSAYIQTETLNLTFARQAATVYCYIRSNHRCGYCRNVIISPHVKLQCAATKPRHRNDYYIFCKFLINPHFDLEPNCIARKPMKKTVSMIYRVFQKTDPLVYFDDNFGKYGPILTIFSLLQHEIYEAQKLSYFSHLTFIMLPLYLAKQTMQIFLDHASKQISMYSNG